MRRTRRVGCTCAVLWAFSLALLLAAGCTANAPAASRLPTPTVAPQLTNPAQGQPAVTDTHSELLTVLAPTYQSIARANVRTVGDRLAVVPSPIYANGIYARDAFYAVTGLEDLALSEQAFRWFEQAQNPQTGQITTAIPFDPADQSLQPQDDETALLFLIWAGVLARSGRPVDHQVVAKAWQFVQSHVVDGAYISRPGQFRYWADCWRLDTGDIITYNQGLYAVAARFLAEASLAGVTTQDVERAAARYRALYNPELGFLPLAALGPGRRMQDTSALLPEFLHRYYFGDGMLPDAAILATVDHRLNTAVVYADDATAAGIKNIATATGAFADPALFACPTLRTPGDYHNGGYWPMYSLVELALAYGIEPRPTYRGIIEQLIAQELADGTAKEYWTLSPGRIGAVQPGRGDYSWNALIVPALRWAGLIPREPE